MRRAARPTRLLLFVALVVGAALLLPALAAALHLGQVGPPDQGGCDQCSAFQLKTAPGQPSYKVPHGKWKIKSWSTQGGGSAGTGRARLLVFRPTSKHGQWRLIGRSHKESIPAHGSPNFATHIPVRGRDRLGIQAIKGISTGQDTGKAGDVEELLDGCSPPGVGGVVGTGASCHLAKYPPHIVNVSAKLRPR